MKRKIKIKNKKFVSSFVFLNSMFILLALLAGYGFFNETVEYSEYHALSNETDEIQAVSEITYSSKGAFFANKKIHVDVNYKIYNDTYFNELNGKRINFIFPESYSYPLEKDDDLGMLLVGSGENIIESKSTRINFDIIFYNSGVYGYRIIVNEDGNILKSNLIQEHLEVSQLSDTLQLKNNNLITALTILTIMLAVDGMLVTSKSKKNK